MKKRAVSIILCFATLFSLFTATAFAAGSDKLPFELTPPKNVYIVDRVGEYTPTTMEVFFDKTFELSEFISLEQKEREEKLKPFGYDDCWFNVEIDWAIDDPTDWKYQPDWDVYDRQRTETEWEFVRESGWVGSGVDHELFQSAFIFGQDYFNAEDPTVDDPNEEWFGDEYQPGVKSMLKDGQYEYITWGYENERCIDFDWTKHTLYLRMRYVAAMDPIEGDRELIVGDWSKTFSYGKGVAPEKIYTAADGDKLPAPHLSDLRVLRKGDKDYPASYEGSGDLLAFTIDDFSDELRQAIMAVKANKDVARMEYIEVKFKDDTEWRQVGITSDLKAGVYYVRLADLAKAGETIDASAYTQVRCVMLYSIYNGLGDDSFYPASNIITIGTPPVTTTTTTTTQSTTKPTTPTTTGATRIAGNGRTDTAAAISKEAFDSAIDVFLASGDSYPDALAGVPLAYAMDAPILLVRPKNGLDKSTLDEMKRLGAKNVCILGGPGAVPDSIKSDLVSRGYKVSRIAGDDRFETALEIAKKLQTIKGTPKEAFFVYSHNYPDALAVSGIAALKGAPILYVYGDGSLRSSAEYMNKYGKKLDKAYIIGGYGAIKEAADENIKAYTKVERVFGDNRYATCSKINDRFADVFSGNSAVCIATGADFPDALAGGVLAARKKAPMLLVSKTLTEEQTAYLKNTSPDSVYVFGGPNAVGQEIYDTAKKFSQNSAIKDMK